ncbi:CaiB/BaiF CoA transferase family protein [Rhizorhapis sp. SPR117]|uniref:CaiB/BaiF CoA transferase family protein n=1 Tax=Rhizorhapis sp. SPR117 TaxID=2912611 RepID=UPI001F1B84F9|nr:CoA transferase [Rhizorhapis sp. SPR117]
MAPLTGLRIVELGGIGPGPMAGMLLGDMGAEVIRIERVAKPEALIPIDDRLDVPLRNRRSVALDIKQPEGLDLLLKLVDSSDGLIEGFRPGVAERLGFGPDVCLARNPGLVFGRVTGFGQEGPLAQWAGHDINYLAITGALNAMGRAGERPAVPLNLIGDYGGGAMLLAFGMVCAFVERHRSQKGQVVDAAMIDGAMLLFAPFFGFSASGSWSAERGTNLLDTGAPFYDVYQTSDNKYVAFGALEPKFFATFAQKVGLDPEVASAHADRARWPMLREALTKLFLGKSRQHWVDLLEHSDSCLNGVLEVSEVGDYPHHQARGAVVRLGGVDQPAPAPRFSRTPASEPVPPKLAGADTDAVLADLGVAQADLVRLRASGTVGGGEV